MTKSLKPDEDYVVVHFNKKKYNYGYPAFCASQETNPGNKYIMDSLAAKLTKDVLEELYPYEEYKIFRIIPV